MRVMLSTLKLPFAGYAYNYFSWGVNVGYLVHQWDLRGSIIVYIGKVRSNMLPKLHDLILIWHKVCIC